MPGPPGSAPPPGYYQAPAFGQPPPTPPPGGYQPAAVGYQYGAGVPSSAELATPGKRILGFIVDWLILLVVYIPLIIVLVVAMADTTTTTDQFGNTYSTESSIGFGGIILFTLAIYGVQVLYHVCFVAVKGQTPGAMLVKVKVVRLSDGQIPGWGPAIMRWIPNLVGVLCSIASLALWIWALVNLFSNPLRQTPFDLAAKTVVIDVS